MNHDHCIKTMIPDGEERKPDPVEGLHEWAHELEAELRRLRPSALDLAKRVQSLEKTLARTEAELDAKTKALRVLASQVDEAVIERRIADAVAAARVHDAALLASCRERAASMEAEMTELRASKRKLREALNRLKDGRGA